MNLTQRILDRISYLCGGPDLNASPGEKYRQFQLRNGGKLARQDEGGKL